MEGVFILGGSMGLNWLEDITAQYYRLQGYIIIQNEDLPLPKTESRMTTAHSDIDTLAIGKKFSDEATCFLYNINKIAVAPSDFFPQGLTPLLQALIILAKHH